MSRFIEFTTSSKNRHIEFTLGNSVHDETVPPAWLTVKGVRIDKQPVDFTDDSVADKLHKTLIEGQQLEKRGVFFDCLTFVMLMSGMDLKDARVRDGQVKFDEETLEDEVGCDDIEITNPVNIGRKFSIGVTFVHTVLPAHGEGEARYMHKLGDKGPICLSGLADAMRMYQCDTANEMTSLTLRP